MSQGRRRDPDEAGDLQNLSLGTYPEGDKVQTGDTSEMIFSVAATVAWLSRTMTLKPGDIVAADASRRRRRTGNLPA